MLLNFAIASLLAGSALARPGTLDMQGRYYANDTTTASTSSTSSSSTSTVEVSTTSSPTSKTSESTTSSSSSSHSWSSSRISDHTTTTQAKTTSRTTTAPKSTTPLSDIISYISKQRASRSSESAASASRAKAASRSTSITTVPSNPTSKTTGAPGATRSPTTKSTAVGPIPSAGSEHGLTGWNSRLKSATFQIILTGVPDLKPDAKHVTPDVDIYDIDLFMTEKHTIDTLKKLNKTVVCYFSGGTYEPGRPDSNKFATADKGSRLAQWPQEKWLKLSSTAVRRIITDRIQLAAQKGCDAIDPDNVDGYGERGGGLSLRKADSISFVKFLAETSKKYNLALGLKNALEMLNDVKAYVQFAVNEECVKANECSRYKEFSSKDKKPVFHIEYPALDRERSLPDVSRRRYCADAQQASLGHLFQTAIKAKKLDGWVQYCNGQVWRTPTINKPSRYSGSTKYVVTDSSKNETTLDFGAEPAADLASFQAEIAKQDGYPFAEGTGSDQWISDEELGGYDLETIEDVVDTQPAWVDNKPPQTPAHDDDFYARWR